MFGGSLRLRKEYSRKVWSKTGNLRFQRGIFGVFKW